MFTRQEIKDRIKALRTQGIDLPPYNLACFIADAALISQRDKSGLDYAHHTEIVAIAKTDSEAKKIIGRLHDVVEDSDWTLDDLREIGFSERVISGVDGVTGRKDELYFNFIVRCSRSPDAVDVKIADLKHNLSVFRNHAQMSEKDLERVNKYILSLNYLADIKRGRMAPGSCFAQWMATLPPGDRSDLLLCKYYQAPARPAPSPAP